MRRVSMLLIIVGYILYYVELKPLDLRLIGGKNEREGRVEVYHNDSWATICDDRWDLRDGDVVCRQLGFSFALAVTIRAAVFGKGNGTILYENSDCLGNETYLNDCAHSYYGDHDCTHGEDVGVVCGATYPDGELTANGRDDPSSYDSASFSSSWYSSSWLSSSWFSSVIDEGSFVDRPDSKSDDEFESSSDVDATASSLGEGEGGGTFDPCLEDKCENGAVCKPVNNLTTEYTCACVFDWSGFYCNNKTDDRGAKDGVDESNSTEVDDAVRTDRGDIQTDGDTLVTLGREEVTVPVENNVTYEGYVLTSEVDRNSDIFVTETVFMSSIGNVSDGDNTITDIYNDLTDEANVVKTPTMVEDAAMTNAMDDVSISVVSKTMSNDIRVDVIELTTITNVHTTSQSTTHMNRDDSPNSSQTLGISTDPLTFILIALSVLVVMVLIVLTAVIVLRRRATNNIPDNQDPEARDPSSHTSTAYTNTVYDDKLSNPFADDVNKTREISSVTSSSVALRQTTCEPQSVQWSTDQL